MTDDLISRAEAMDASEKFIKDCNPDHFVGHQKFIEYMDNAEIGSFGKWQFANGFNMGLTAAEVAIKNLPSAQPTYTDAEIQKMQEMEQAQIEKAYQLGREDAEPKWIPCSKKLPKRTSLYYVTIRDEKNDIEYTSCMNFYVNLALWEVDVNVIAWMPLPKPYKPQEME